MLEEVVQLTFDPLQFDYLFVQHRSYLHLEILIQDSSFYQLSNKYLVLGHLLVCKLEGFCKLL